ncbi:MAG: hypothetical protein K0R54_789 [Clostridiaceae bacterium]|jgi:hypothetical protein|nr:hypothetical protein [Clostridiaceae bacterium]
MGIRIVNPIHYIHYQLPEHNKVVTVKKENEKKVNTKSFSECLKEAMKAK